MDQHSEQRDRLEELAEEFLLRRRRGESPSVEDYARRHPDLAAEIRELFPLTAMMDDAAAPSSSRTSDSVPVAAETVMEFTGDFGDFRILREIGRGGMGIVYEAEQISLHRRVALKILRGHLLADRLQQQRFEREAQAAARLHHKHIVPVFGVGKHHDQLYYVMQYIPGKGLDRVLCDLRDWQQEAEGPAPGLSEVLWTAAARGAPPDPAAPTDIAPPETGDRPGELQTRKSPAWDGASDAPRPLRNPPRDYWRSVARVGLQVAGALDYAHSHNLLHRDIKPSNLLLDPAGSVWITDFGLAKSEGEDHGLTRTGDIVGTLRYLAPEALSGRYDKRSDVYALGLTIYEMLALRPAFDESDRQRMIAQIARGVPLLSRVNPNVPADLVAIVHKATDLEPARRYASAGELADDLQRFLHHEPVRARRVTTTEQIWRWARQNRSLAAALTALMLLLVAAAVGSVAVMFYLQEQTIKAIEAQITAEANEELANRNLYYSQMQQAREAAMMHRGTGRLHELLASWHPLPGQTDLRGWEWYYLYATSHRQLATWRTLDNARAADWSPTGERFATGHLADAESGEGRVLIWDARGRIRLELGSHRGDVSDVAWSPDGRLLASAGGDREVRVWDPDTGGLLRVLQHDEPVWAIAWSPDALRLAAGDDQGVISCWTLPASPRQPPVREQLGRRGRGPVAAVAWRPASASQTAPQLAALGRDGVARLWDAQAGELLRRWSVGEGGCHALAWSADGAMLAAAGEDHRIHLWEADGEGPLRQLLGHTHRVLDVQFASQDQQLVSCGEDDTVRVWRIDTGEQLDVWRSHTNAVRAIGVQPGQRRVLSAGEDHTLRLWDLDGRSRAQPLPPAEPSTRRGAAAAWSDDGRYLAVARGQRQVEVWDDRRNALVRRIEGREAAAADVDWTVRDSQWLLAIAYADGGVDLWTESAGVFLTLRLDSPLLTIRWSPDGRRLAVSDAEGEVHLWDTESGRHRPLRRLARGESRTRGLHWSKDGRWLAAGSSNGLLRIWDAQEPGPPLIAETIHNGEITCLAWSPLPDGVLATGGADRSVQLWKFAATGELQPLRTLTGHNDHLESLAWSPDGRRLATASVDTSVRLWDPDQGKETLALLHFGSAVSQVAWHPSGMKLAAAGELGQLHVWDATEGFRAAMSPLMLPALELQLAGDPNDLAALRQRANIHAALRDWDEAAADFDKLTRLLDPVGARPQVFSTVTWLSESRSPTDAQDPPAPPQAMIPLPQDGLPNLPRQFSPEDPLPVRLDTRVYCSQQQLLAIPTPFAQWRALRVNGRDVDVVPGEPTPVLLLQGWNVVEADLAVDQHSPVAPILVSDQPLQIVQGLVSRREWPQAIAYIRDAAARDPDHTDLQRRLARTHLLYAEHLEASRSAFDVRQARMQRERAVEVLQAQFEKRPNETQLVELLCDALLQLTTPLGLFPEGEASSLAGATLQRRPGGGWRVSGEISPTDEYHLAGVAATSPRGLLLEALPDPELPFHGPGRRGNFHLTGVRVFAGGRPLTLSGAFADHHRPPDHERTTEDDGPQAVLDRSDATRWDIWPRLGERHWLAVTWDEEVPENSRLEVRLEFRDRLAAEATLGCFRLYLCDAERMPAALWWRWTAVGKVSPWTRLAAARWLLDDPAGVLAALREDDRSAEAEWLRTWAIAKSQRLEEAANRLGEIPETPPHAGLGPLIEEVRRLLAAKAADPPQGGEPRTIDE